MLSFSHNRRLLLCLLLSYLLVFAVFAVPVLAGQRYDKNERITYIDAHNHLVGHFPSPRGPVEDWYGAARVALATMNKLGIRKMIVLPPPFPPNHPGIYDIKYLGNITKKFPGRFAFLGGGESLNVMIQKSIHDEQSSSGLRQKFIEKARQIMSEGAIGFGEFAVEHLCLGPRHNYQSAPSDHPLFLLLADIAAAHNVPIDIHMEAVARKMSLPKRLDFPANPRVLSPNVEAFERLLAHNRKTKIIWSHLGWDNTGHRTPALTRKLLKRHPNLYMSFKISPRDSLGETCPILRGHGIKTEWLELLNEFPDRFIIGSDQFYLSPGMHGQIGPRSAEPTNRFFSLLPEQLARKIGYETDKRVFNLTD